MIGLRSSTALQTVSYGSASAEQAYPLPEPLDSQQVREFQKKLFSLLESSKLCSQMDFDPEAKKDGAQCTRNWQKNVLICLVQS